MVLSRAAILVMAGAVAVSPACAAREATINENGEVGRTSYKTLPFQNDVWGQSWASTGGLSPCQLYWDKGPHFTNAKLMADAKGASRDIAAKGLVPCAGSQRWNGTFMSAQPPQPGEPSWVGGDRGRGKDDISLRGDFQEWVRWTKARPNLLIIKKDGKEWTEKHGNWVNYFGHISPLMPLSQADAQSIGLENATYGQWYAYRYGQCSKLTGAFGVMLSDFSDCQGDITADTGFNPEIIDAFAKYLGHDKTSAEWGRTIAEKARYIDNNLFNEWTDYTCIGYAKFWGALAYYMGKGSGHEALVVNQSGDSAAYRRLRASDNRLVAKYMSPKNILCGWDDITMGTERGGESQISGIAGVILAAAREPDIRNGANLPADNDTFWQAVQKHWQKNPNWEKGNFANTPPELKKRGLYELRRFWLEFSWSHIADRGGNTRRALCFMSRHYWDGGKLDPKLVKAIQGVYPARPFGMAIYYSVPTERKLELSVGKGQNAYWYYSFDTIGNFKNGGGAANYYISDAALEKPEALENLKTKSKPAAWLVLDKPEMLTPEERAKLTSIAPILTNLQQARNFPDAPIKFSNAGLTGYGFYDQRERLIVVATNLSDKKNGGSVSLRGLAAGDYEVEDLFGNGSKSGLSVEDAGVSIPLSLEQWETRVLAIAKK